MKESETKSLWNLFDVTKLVTFYLIESLLPVARSVNRSAHVGEAINELWCHDVLVRREMESSELLTILGPKPTTADAVVSTVAKPKSPVRRKRAVKTKP